ncbi:MAG TPA: DUF937 domain-containing protein, partial [Pyrinomonadaceae bacterium]|nr:DUF937 domain-containing protein [Pyrinomonadaceae bacterium]
KKYLRHAGKKGAIFMNAITQIVTQQLGGSAARTIAQRFGISESTANTAIQMAVPLILTALARNASQPQEAQNLHQAVATDHDGSILDNVMGYLQNPQSANGAGILGHVFGGQQPAIENNLAQATGMDQSSAGGLLETLAPLVMGSLGRAQQQNGLDASGLSDLLNSQQQEAQANAPGAMSMLSSLLDQNKDGSSMDDLQRMAASFFK